jgi:hypothetical protein
MLEMQNDRYISKHSELGLGFSDRGSVFLWGTIYGPGSKTGISEIPCFVTTSGGIVTTT